ncbi:four-carbon acid sugar kinase family protein [Microbacterium excoecariae]|uniref:four-carbon acid sugar kinase family protein n=1 Tax=Microbacterium excoecariae TaxID=2715210 RepID=UPI00140C963E
MSRTADLAFYGDDFTGSVDVLLQCARRGWSARLFVGRPTPEALAAAAARHDAVGIAGIARSLPTADLEDEVGPALDLLRGAGARIVQYKACSTADSSPETGSLGRVLEIAAARFPGPWPLLFAQPDFGRYTAFAHHFADERGTVYRLDRQPTMAHHPSTPMRESDLVRHLGAQTDLPLTSIPFTAYASGGLAERIRASGPSGVLLDALDETHLRAVGAAVADLAGIGTDRAPLPVFAIGSGGLTHAVTSADPRGTSTVPDRASGGGPVLVVSGSRSAQTRRQANAAAARGWLVQPLPLDPGADLGFVAEALRAGRSVVLTSDDADISSVPEPDLLRAVGAACARAARAALADGSTRRLVVCGGDTSSRVATLLGVRSLSLAANPWANVVLLTAHADEEAVDGAQLLLKGGQVGSDDLFEDVRALR